MITLWNRSVGTGMVARRSRTDAFTLVEVTLALLVVAIGLVTVFSLFPTGLSQAKKSSDETQAAVFAEEVFAGYRGMVESDAVLWERLGTASAPGLGAACAGMWTNWGGGITVKVAAVSSAPLTVRYRDWNGMVQYAFRYDLEFGDAGAGGDVKYGRLRVWTGEYGSSDPKDAVDFYTEFYNYAVRP
jgi:type II secretory pathway pseudopilin PulG